MRVKMLIEFDFDPETGDYTPISREIIEEGAATPKKAKSVMKDDGSTEPIVILEENKLVLNSKAVEVLGAEWEDRISVIYQKHEDKLVPVIGKDEVFGCKSGNKLTKSKTVSCRGKANTKLAEHGTEFKLIPLNNDTFIMDGGVDIPYVEDSKKKRVDPKIKVVEDDIPEVLPMEATLDGDGSEEITEEFKFEL
nr:MAG TPA: hypothetical protein [Caudoviricetes sp.]